MGRWGSSIRFAYLGDTHPQTRTLRYKSTNTQRAMAMANNTYSSNSRRRPHVLCIPYPFQGHLSPMMNLALKLASSFHDLPVTFLTTHHCLFRLLRASKLTDATDFAAFLASHNVESSADIPHSDIILHYPCRQLGLDADSGIRLVGISDGWPLQHDRSDFNITIAELDSVEAHLEGEIEAFIRRSSSDSTAEAVTCIMSDSYMPYTQDIADRLGIPRVFVWTQSMAVACANYSYSISALGYDPFTQDVTHRGQMGADFMVRDLPGLPPMDPYDMPFYTGVGNVEAAAWMAKKVHKQFSRINDAEWVLANSFHDLEGAVLQALKPSIPKLLLVGPLNVVHQIEGKKGRTSSSLLRASVSEDDGQCLAWLDTKPDKSVLFISFGSFLPLSVENISEICRALLNVCCSCAEVCCLWVCKFWTKEMFEAEFWADLVEKSGRVMVVDWAPQVEVLGHRAVGGFFSHTGWNSTVESVSMGVPMICSPLYVDQYTNSWHVVHVWKMGLELHSIRDEELNKESGKRVFLVLRGGEVEAAIRRLMVESQGAELRQSAAKLKAAARRAWDVEGGSSRKDLEVFVAYLFEG